MEQLVPAYGRDYKTAKSCVADFLAGKDFERSAFIRTGGTYTSIQDFQPGQTVIFRFCGQRKVCSHKIKAGDIKIEP